jgi:CheY-like chemotaxis protein
MDDENVLDVQLSDGAGKTPGAPIDGLGSALERLDEQVTTIVVVDDNPMDSRLIRRLLQAKKPYRVFEAHSAPEGFEMIKERLPDLVVSDLTMPGMDGFTLLEELKKDPVTAKIPVIVVSAKDLTPEDERRLAGRTSSIWLKGSFSTDDLVEDVVGTLSNSRHMDTSAPLSADHDETIVDGTQAAAPSKTRSNSGDLKKVVLIEDNPVDARLISRILQMSCPVEIKQVQAGQEALDVIEAEQPDLVILDLIIPDKSGFQILEELRHNKKLDAISVIVITSKDLSETEKELLKTNGVRSMWQKGNLDRDKLVAHVQTQLE